MKNFYILALTAISTIATDAQNLVTNGNLENWTDNTTLESFAPFVSGTFSANNFLTKESGITHDGSFSARHTSQSTTQAFETELIVVTPGHTYTLSYWYLDNDTAARTRNWSTWLDSSFDEITTDDAILHETAYSTENPNWIQKSVTITAPAGATRFRFQIRTYRQAVGADGGSIYYDGLSFVDNSLGVKENAISGLRIYPNPVKDGNLFITSDYAEPKHVVIFDVLGRPVIQTTVNNDLPLNVSQLQGMYIVKITENGKIAARKLVIN